MDVICPELLKALDILVKILFQCCMEVRELPRDWQTGIVVPTLMRGNAECAPITITLQRYWRSHRSSAIQSICGSVDMWKM